MSSATDKALSRSLELLSDTYDRSKIPGISRRHFRHAEMMEVFENLRSKYPSLFRLDQVGTSIEGRSLNLLTAGEGRTKILMWSQMHGDESTATRALLDILSMMGLHGSESYFQSILRETTLLLLPMLNPDGAERLERRNAQGVDINRDALALQTPEARVLRQVRDRFSADFGFNLHDQEPRFVVGQTDRIAALALLAPAYNKEKGTNEVRLKAKQLAALFTRAVSHFIPGHVSRYDDSFDPRAFGDRMQQWGTSTLLVESGGWFDASTGLLDPDKEYLRKLNAVGLIASCYGIASGVLNEVDVGTYEELPENNGNVFDLMIKNAVLCQPDSTLPVEVDVGINIHSQQDGETREWKSFGEIVDLGDLTPFRALRTIDARGRSLSISGVSVGRKIPWEQLNGSTLFEE